jgi:hypothetical protein
VITPTERHIDETVTDTLGAAASLAQIASHVTDTAATPVDGPEELKTKALGIQAQVQRATLALASLAAHAGRLEAFAVVGRLAAEGAERRAHADRVAVTAEARRDAELFHEDRADNAGAELSAEEWARDAFDGTWGDEWDPAVMDRVLCYPGAKSRTLTLDRESAWECYRAAFLEAAGGAS